MRRSGRDRALVNYAELAGDDEQEENEEENLKPQRKRLKKKIQVEDDEQRDYQSTEKIEKDTATKRVSKILKISTPVTAKTTLSEAGGFKAFFKNAPPAKILPRETKEIRQESAHEEKVEKVGNRTKVLKGNKNDKVKSMRPKKRNS